ncbi:3363_t:CDS:1 [Paraglomus brasilianum]|uniref:Origin recognition complex subunit 2 n=1 Tax=Paraglomus brasilianum TaxID=144538 RepID=A0A9N9GL31_9GLOM|nr:3363_t:CDS:1 [Paraglomus brasilianum]
MNLYDVSHTSNNTLSSLPILDQTEYIDIVKSVQIKHKAERNLLVQLHQRQFPQWYFELTNGFNLVFYGYGSKRQLLTLFAKTVLKDKPLLVVNGCFPSVSLKNILANILDSIIKESHGTSGSVEDHTSFIFDYFCRADRAIDRLYILIFNIDGVNLRSERTQTCLSILASNPNIHLVASVDHINAGLLYDNVRASRFNWVWHDITTYEPYIAETSFENSIMIRREKALGIRGIEHVLGSLTENARGIFKILCEHQIAGISTSTANNDGHGTSGKNHGVKPEDVGVAYGVLYKKCREAWLVSNDLTFKTQLTEFRDHQIIQSRRMADGTEILYIPLSKDQLINILDNLEF